MPCDAGCRIFNDHFGPCIVKPSEGVKYDEGKADWTLLPWDGLAEVRKVLEFGARKYAPDNWRKVERERYRKALARHVIAYLAGEENDPETGLSHLAHAACCALFMLALDKSAAP